MCLNCHTRNFHVEVLAPADDIPLEKVYVATGDGDILWFAMSFVSGVPTVETSSTGTVSSKGVSYLAIHPHGTVRAEHIAYHGMVVARRNCDTFRCSRCLIR